jgi:hypothetical protein
VSTALAAFVVTVTAIATAGVAAAQAPVVNARVERRAVTQGLAREVQAVMDRGSAAWLGYSVPLLQRTDGTLRSSEWYGSRCRLEPPTQLVVLARVEARALVELRSVAVDCDLDASGMPLVWLDNVSADDSVAWLASLVGNTAATPRDWRTDAAISALARHASPGAVAPIARLAREGVTTQLRTRGISALAQRPAADALPTLNAVIDKDQDRSVKRQAVSALNRLAGGAGVPRLTELARSHQDPEIRKYAMQVLGQSRDPRAVDFLTQVLLK